MKQRRSLDARLFSIDVFHSPGMCHIIMSAFSGLAFIKIYSVSRKWLFSALWLPLSGMPSGLRLLPKMHRNNAEKLLFPPVLWDDYAFIRSSQCYAYSFLLLFKRSYLTQNSSRILERKIAFK